MNPEASSLGSYDFPKLVESFNKTDIKMQIQAIDKAVELNYLLVSTCVCALQNGPNRYFVAERLPHFGSVVVKPLTLLLEESNDEEVKILASLVLLRLGSKLGVSKLLDAVLTEPMDRYASLIVQELAKNGVDEASYAILTRLRHYQAGENDLGKSFASNRHKDLIVSLLEALKKLSVELPLDLKSVFLSLDMPKEIRSSIS